MADKHAYSLESAGVRLQQFACPALDALHGPEWGLLTRSVQVCKSQTGTRQVSW
jgi:hypothetical protein